MSTPIPSLGNKTLEQLRVAELREELRKRGANIKGLKKDLVERLDEILHQEAAEAAAEAEESKKSSPDPVSDEEKEAPAAAVVVVEVATQPAEEDAAVKELEPEPVEPLSGDDIKPETVELAPEADDFPTRGKEAERDGPDVTATEPEFVPESEAVVMEPLGSATAESVPEADSLSPQTLDEYPRAEEDSGPAEEVIDEGKTLDGEAKLESEYMRDEKVDSGKDIIMSDGVVEAEGTTAAEVEAQDQTEELAPVRRHHPTPSTDAVIMEAYEAEEIPAEKATLSEGLVLTAYGERDGEEEESVVEETGGEQTEMMTTTVETVSVVTETTVVTTETVVVNEVEAEGEGSFTQRSSDAGTLSIEGKAEEEAIDKQNKDKDEEGMEVEQDAKAKDSKPMEIDSNSLTGVKRKDGEELRQPEPAKRQRRWNSDKSIGASADAPKVITTDTFKETGVPEGRVGSQTTPVAPSPSSTPKASAASSSFEKPALSRPVLSKTDIAVNGDMDKKRVVPSPTGSPTVSLKIDRFVRPFTIKAVRELLEQTGTVKEMWMDQIKTHCYVTYSSVEEAIATRNALYHLQWPVAGGKLLIAEFAEPEEVKSRVDGTNDKPASTPVTTPRGSANSSTQVAGAMGITPPAVHVPTSALPPPPPLPPPPRERPALPPKKEPEPPIPTLDDLFKKTRTRPQVYFLPLTEEQVADKLRNKQPVSKAPVKA